MQEAHLELTMLRCPRCAGQLVLRVMAEERGRSVMLTLDTACVACGVSPWSEPDERAVVFTPGASIESPHAPDAEARLAAAQARIDGLLRRIDSLENSLAAAQRNLQRARQSDVEAGLREEISRLEGQLADARAEVRRSEEATRGQVATGKRPIEIE
jgi:predicted  nucleic acid-binding Zn-ribbon protein